MRDVAATVSTIALVLAASGAWAVPQSRDQQRCIITLTKDGARLAAAQGKENTGCVRDAGRGRIVDPQACLAADTKGRVAKARARTVADAVEACAVPPDFGVGATFEEVVTLAAVTHARGLAADLLGPDLTPAIIRSADDKGGAACQATVAKAAEKLAAARIDSFAACVKSALRGGATSGADLDACHGQDAKGKIAAAAARLAAGVDRRCAGVDLSRAFPGRCTGPSADAFASCVATRVACRTCRLLTATGDLDVDCDLADDGAANASCRFLVSLSGNAFPFVGSPVARIAGAEVWVLERPEVRVTTAEDGSFRLDGLEEGSEATVVLEHPEYTPIQAGTIRLGPLGAERVTFQAVTQPIYDAFAALLGIVPDATRCQMVTTVTRVGRSIYDPGAHGEDAVTVTLAPPLPPEHGPIYFNSSVLPDRTLTQTSDDGGVLFIQVPPGEYLWTARKPGKAITRVKMKCRAPFLVNASPPWGLQTH